MQTDKKGKLVIISGPSGVGKSTVSAELVRKTGAFLSISNTTRPQGNGEINGEDYWFLSKVDFTSLLIASTNSLPASISTPASLYDIFDISCCPFH